MDNNQEFIYEIVIVMLHKYHNNISKLAEKTHLSRATIHRIIKEKKVSRNTIYKIINHYYAYKDIFINCN